MSEHRSIPSVVGVAVLRSHVMRLLFDDGVVRDIQYLPGHVQGSGSRPSMIPTTFAQVQVDPEAGTVVWPNARRHYLELADDVYLHHGDITTVVVEASERAYRLIGTCWQPGPRSCAKTMKSGQWCTRAHQLGPALRRPAAPTC